MARYKMERIRECGQGFHTGQGIYILLSIGKQYDYTMETLETLSKKKNLKGNLTLKCMKIK